jgi:nucleotide-binding universal stress UspA family protein
MKTPVAKRSPRLSRRFERPTVSGLPLPAIEIKSILVPLDFSQGSLEALNYALPIAKKFGAAIHLVHVTEPDEAFEVSGASHLMLETARSIEFLGERLPETHRKHLSAFGPENCHVRAGRPYQKICGLARKIDADLIVLGTRGYTGVKRILLGSTAERVVRFASRPVLVVRRRGRKQPKEFILHKILAPIDFSQCSMSGAMYAALFAKTFDAKLLFLHVFSGVMPTETGKVSKPLKKNDAIDLENARLDMEAFTQLDFLRDVNCTTEIRAGYAVDEICCEAAKSDVDLVVIATHGRSGFNRMLLGNTAEHVVRYAECPVMAVPSLPPSL